MISWHCVTGNNLKAISKLHSRIVTTSNHWRNDVILFTNNKQFSKKIHLTLKTENDTNTTQRFISLRRYNRRI